MLHDNLTQKFIERWKLDPKIYYKLQNRPKNLFSNQKGSLKNSTSGPPPPPPLKFWQSYTYFLRRVPYVWTPDIKYAWILSAKHPSFLKRTSSQSEQRETWHEFFL